jgi:hypothetical protein
MSSRTYASPAGTVVVHGARATVFGPVGIPVPVTATMIEPSGSEPVLGASTASIDLAALAASLGSDASRPAQLRSAFSRAGTAFPGTPAHARGSLGVAA